MNSLHIGVLATICLLLFSSQFKIRLYIIRTAQQSFNFTNPNSQFFPFPTSLANKTFFFHFWQMIRKFETTQKKRAKKMYDKTEKTRLNRLFFLIFRICSEWQNDIWWLYKCFVFDWWLPKEFQSVPDNCLTTAWQMLSTFWHRGILNIIAKQNLILLLN